MDEPPASGVAESAPAPAPSTGRQAAWNYLVFGLSKSSALLTTVVVARLLDPADFGLFALALLIINFFDYLKDLGVGAALVQSPGSWKRFAPTGLTLVTAFGVLAGAGLAIAAPLAGSMLGQPELTNMVRVLAIAVTISAIGILPAALLRRRLDFKRRLWPEFTAAIIKAVLTIALAATGFGVWSLVYGQLVGAVALAVLYWWVARTPLDYGFDPHEARHLVRYGVSVTGVTLLAFGIASVDYAVVGIRLGDTALGLYTLAFRIPELLVLNLCVVISEVLFSSLSRLQKDRRSVGEHYLQVLAVVVPLTAPICVALGAAAPAVIATLYGPQYAEAAPVLAVLAVYGLIHSASFHAGDVFKAIGRPGLLTATGAAKLAILIWPIWWAAGHSIVMVAVVLLLAELVPLVANFVLVRVVTGIPLASLAKVTLRPLPAAAAMALVMVGVTYSAGRWPAPIQLVVAMLAGFVCYLLVLRLTARGLYDQGFSAVRSLRRGSAPGLDADTEPADPEHKVAEPESGKDTSVVNILSQRRWRLVAACGVIGLLAGALLGSLVLGGTKRYTAEATLAMLPASYIPTSEAAGYWEVLNHGQATRSAALVLGQGTWLPTAAAAAGVAPSELSLTAGAVRDTTLIGVTIEANSPEAAEAALSSVLIDATGPATDISGPFRLEVIKSPVGSAQSINPSILQTAGAGGIAGLALGAGIGLLAGRRPRRSDPDLSDRARHAAGPRADEACTTEPISSETPTR
ncbi:lipopolysaccharide biosynthesis protein [Mycolicibacterium gilvum]|uniref:lipopolysaccharide biosynthesis protein n=1 Tax=Mycolicibacterium gilvum TaxID=1804 RepID=UPI004046080F